MTRTNFYDRISLFCLIIGCAGLAVSLYEALQHQWLNTAIFFTATLLIWHISSLFARFAIAAAGRQK